MMGKDEVQTWARDVKDQLNIEIVNHHVCAVECLESLRMTDEPVKLWDVKVEVHEEFDVEVVEMGGIDLGQKVLRILINAFEVESSESGKDKACGRRQRLAFWVGARLRGKESKIKVFESGHDCEGSGQRVG